MKISGAQIEKIAEIADGAEITLNRAKGQSHVDLQRDDGLRVRVHEDGSDTLLAEAHAEVGE